MTALDLDRYHRDGYQELGRRLSDVDVDAVARRFAELDAATHVPKSYEAEYDGEGAIRRLRKLRRLLWNDRMLFGPMLNRAGAPEVAETIVGPGAVVVFHAAFLKPARIGTHVGLHQDQALWNHTYPSGFSMWFALTDVAPRNGGLFGCPGSHRDGTLPHAEDPGHLWHHTLRHRAEELAEPYQFHLAPGDAVIWDRHFAHGSAANTSGEDRQGMVVVFANGAADGFDTTDGMTLDEIRALDGV